MSTLNKAAKKLKPLLNILPKGVQKWAQNNFIQVRPSLVTETALKPKVREALSYLIQKLGDEQVGDYLEFGVFAGSSLALTYDVIKEKKLDQVRLFGFDSFEGLPESAATDDNGAWEPGQFSCNLKTARYNLTQRGIDWQRAFLVKGWFSETLTKETKATYGLQKASLIMVDCDMYISAIEALRFCAELIKDKAVVIFDDWNSLNLAEQNMGEKKAFDEFLQENPHLQAEDFGTYTCEGAPNGQLFLLTNTSNR